MLLDILDVVTTVALLYIIASGLFVVFGVMSVINLSHGAFIVLGAYTSIVVTGVAINPWWNFVLAPAVGFVFGAAIEFIVIRRLYARSLDTILATVPTPVRSSRPPTSWPREIRTTPNRIRSGVAVQ